MVARKYFTSVVKQFEEYTDSRYLRGLRSPDSDAATLLASLKFIETREITGHDAALRELFTSPRAALAGGKIAEACLDAMITTCESRVQTARFLATAATDPALRSVALVTERGLWQLRAESIEAVLGELMRPYEGERLRAIVRLLHRLSEVRPPEPIKFWRDADLRARVKAVGVWRQRIREAGIPKHKP